MNNPLQKFTQANNANLKVGVEIYDGLEFCNRSRRTALRPAIVIDDEP
jgi:hypothetical protein